MQADFVAGQAVGQYLLALCPHEALWKEIKTIKENFKNQYACAQAMYGSGHIALAVFTQYEIFEKRIMAQLRMAAKNDYTFLQ